MTPFTLTLTQGDSFSRTYSLDGYLPADYTLHAAFRGQSSLDLTATADLSNFVLTITPAQSSALNPGNYQVSLYLTSPTERITLLTHSLTIYPDPLNLPDGVDVRTHVERVLDAVTAYIEARAVDGSVDHLVTEVDGLKLTRMSMKELTDLRDLYQDKVARLKGLHPKVVSRYFTNTVRTYQ
jgi:hypothetical protein